MWILKHIKNNLKIADCNKAYATNKTCVYYSPKNKKEKNIRELATSFFF